MRLERGRAPYRAIAGLPRHKNAAALIKARKAKRFFAARENIRKNGLKNLKNFVYGGKGKRTGLSDEISKALRFLGANLLAEK